MKKILSMLMVLIIVSSMLTGCGGAKKSATATQSIMPGVSNSTVGEGRSSGATSEGLSSQTAGVAKDVATTTANATNGKTSADSSAIVSSSSTSLVNLSANSILNQRKVIRNANVSVEVEDFEVSYGKIKSMISAFGYVQESTIKRDKVVVGNETKYVTRGVIIIRVDKDRFDSVLSDVKGLGLLLDENIKSDDVTDKFFDLESQLRLLKYEQSRLEEYLLKATDPDTIFKTESRLTGIRQEIERLTGTLQKWNDLVELSTITINMGEKRPDAAQDEKNPYWKQLINNFTDSISGTFSFLGDVLLFLAAALPALVLLAIIFVLFRWIYRKYLKNLIASRRTSKKNEKGPGM